MIQTAMVLNRLYSKIGIFGFVGLLSSLFALASVHPETPPSPVFCQEALLKRPELKAIPGAEMPRLGFVLSLIASQAVEELERRGNAPFEVENKLFFEMDSASLKKASKADLQLVLGTITSIGANFRRERILGQIRYIGEVHGANAIQTYFDRIQTGLSVNHLRVKEALLQMTSPIDISQRIFGSKERDDFIKEMTLVGTALAALTTVPLSILLNWGWFSDSTLSTAAQLMAGTAFVALPPALYGLLREGYPLGALLPGEAGQNYRNKKANTRTHLRPYGLFQSIERMRAKAADESASPGWELVSSIQIVTPHYLEILKQSGALSEVGEDLFKATVDEVQRFFGSDANDADLTRSQYVHLWYILERSRKGEEPTLYVLQSLNGAEYRFRSKKKPKKKEAESRGSVWVGDGTLKPI